MEGIAAQAEAAVEAVREDIVTVGGAIVICAAAVMAFRWIKASFF